MHKITELKLRWQNKILISALKATTELAIVFASRLVKTNENFNELYAVIGEGGQISLTDLSGVAIDSFENFPSTDSAPVLAGINNDTQGSELEFFRLVSDSFDDPTKDDSISFDVSQS